MELLDWKLIVAAVLTVVIAGLSTTSGDIALAGILGVLVFAISYAVLAGIHFAIEVARSRV